MTTNQAQTGGHVPSEPREQTVRRCPEALWRHTFTGTMILPCDSAEPLLIDGPGSIIWNQLEDYRTAEQLVDVLAADFAAERTAIRDDLHVFLHELARHGLVEWKAS